MDNQRLVDLFNKIHQFNVWAFAVLDLEGEPVVVTDGRISKRPILQNLRFDIIPALLLAVDAVDIAQEKAGVLVRYRDEIAEYCIESGIDPPYGSGV